jgi:hypothetical protein
MRAFLSNILVGSCFSITTLACKPMASTHTIPKGLKIVSEVQQENGSTFVKLDIKHPEDSLPWNIEFIDEKPEDLQIIQYPTNTVFRWQIDSSRFSRNRPISHIEPYKIQLSNAKCNYSASVEFETVSQQIASDFNQMLVRTIIDVLVHVH